MATVFCDAAATGANDGSDWEDAYTSLATAITNASASDEVWVKEGTTTAHTSCPYTLKANVLIYGGFSSALTGTSGSVSGRDLDNDITYINGQDTNRCLTFVSDAHLDGFHVINGHTTGSGACGEPNNFDDCILENCKFDGHNSSGYGGAFRFRNADGWEWTNCIISNNNTDQASRNGGGLSIDTVTGTTFDSCTFDTNETSGAYSGGSQIYVASSTITFTDCEFKNGLSPVDSTAAIEIAGNNITFTDCTIHGHDNVGISLAGTGTHTLTRCSIYSNDYRGVSISSDDVDMVDCRIYSNGGANFINGGGVYLYGGSADADLTSCLVYDNQVTNSGGGIHLHTSGDALLLKNCVVADNDSNYNACGLNVNAGSATVRNSIFWGNTGTEITAGETVTYSDVQGGYTGTGNINSDPSFVGSGDDSYNIQSGSPCIDAGDGTYAPSTDILGNSRYDDPATANTGTGSPAYTDIGAYEFQGTGAVDPAIFFGCNF